MKNKIYNFLSNFLEDDLPDHLRLDKFRTTPDDGQIERIPSSLEVLQAKLNTISESTESNFSTPRNKTTSPGKNKQN